MQEDNRGSVYLEWYIRVKGALSSMAASTKPR